MIRLETIEAAVVGEPGKVFSTSPEVALGEDGNTYFIKGRNSETAFAEVAGCRLARFAGIPVPHAHVGSFEGNLYAAVESVPNAQRNVRPWLRDQSRIKNLSQLFEMIAVDSWLVNDDRNMGNVVGSALGDGNIDIFAIDFERSRTLAEGPFMTVGRIDPRRLWPTAELGDVLRRIKPRACPQTALRAIRTLSLSVIRDIVIPVAAELPFVTWHDSSIELLARRAKDIDTVMEEIWAAN